MSATLDMRHVTALFDPLQAALKRGMASGVCPLHVLRAINDFIAEGPFTVERRPAGDGMRVLPSPALRRLAEIAEREWPAA